MENPATVHAQGIAAPPRPSLSLLVFFFLSQLSFPEHAQWDPDYIKTLAIIP